MDSIVIVLIVLVLALAGIAAWFLFRERRSRRLREHFGPEYERSIEAPTTAVPPKPNLSEREKRHRELDIRPLENDERKRFADRWTGVQQGFVDDPSRAVGDADSLVDDLMRARGYPLDDFEQRAADISVEHPVVVQRYREARDIADAERGRASRHRGASPGGHLLPRTRGRPARTGPRRRAGQQGARRAHSRRCQQRRPRMTGRPPGRPGGHRRTAGAPSRERRAPRRRRRRDETTTTRRHGRCGHDTRRGIDGHPGRPRPPSPTPARPTTESGRGPVRLRRRTARRRHRRTGDRHRGAAAPEALIPADRSADYRGRWDAVEGPVRGRPAQRRAVGQHAGRRGARRARGAVPPAACRPGAGPVRRATSTEDLRLALRRYRSFFDRLLSF